MAAASHGDSFDHALAANRRYASGFSLAGLSPRAATGLGIVTCMDSRIEPLTMLGLEPGDAKILRNAGGRVTPDVLRSLVLATASLGVTHVAVVHHTGCALAGRSERDVRASLPPGQADGAGALDFLAMPDPDAALRADVQAVRTCRALAPGVQVQGWRYDVDSGLVERVVV